MTEKTLLDLAHEAMQSDPDDKAARMQFYERLADSELFLLLKEEAVGDNLLPEFIEVESGKYLLAFDREERLAEFTSIISSVHPPIDLKLSGQKALSAGIMLMASCITLICQMNLGRGQRIPPILLKRVSLCLPILNAILFL